MLAAEIARSAGDLLAAQAEAAVGLNAAEASSYGQLTIDLHLMLARIHLAMPEPQAALRQAREALDRAQHADCQYAWGEANALHLCGLCHRALGERELAQKRFEAALRLRERIQHPEVEQTRKLLQELTER